MKNSLKTVDLPYFINPAKELREIDILREERKYMRSVGKEIRALILSNLAFEGRLVFSSIGFTVIYLLVMRLQSGF